MINGCSVCWFKVAATVRQRLQTVIEPSSGEEVQDAVKAILSTSPEVAATILDTIK